MGQHPSEHEHIPATASFAAKELRIPFETLKKTFVGMAAEITKTGEGSEAIVEVKACDRSLLHSILAKASDLPVLPSSSL